MSNIISINNCNIDVSSYQQENSFYIKKWGKTTTYFNETHKSCNTCGEIKEFKYFYKGTSTVLKLHGSCKSCLKDYQKRYQKENEDNLKENRKEYYKNNKENGKKYRKSYTKYNENKLPLGYETRNKDEFLQIQCYKCGEWMFVTNNQLAGILSAQKGTMRGQHNIYCSDECKHTCSEYYNRSTNREIEAFELGLALFEYDLLINNSIDLNTMKIAINAAKERDGYECQNCGNKEDLHGHHIIPKSLCLGTDDEYLIYETSNIKTVCSDCHYNKEHTDDLSLRELRGHNKTSKCLM